MEQYIYDETNGLWYERDGDYNAYYLTKRFRFVKPIKSAMQNIICFA